MMMTTTADTEDVETLLDLDEPVDGWSEVANAAQLIGNCIEGHSSDVAVGTATEPVPKLKSRWCLVCRCCGMFKSPINALMLLLQTLLFVGSTGLVAAHSVARFKSHGFCVLTAKYEADFTMDYTDYNMPCDMPMFTSIIVIAFVFTMFALNWIAGLYNTKCWLRLQTSLTVLVTALAIICTVLLAVSFLQWCDNMKPAFDDLPSPFYNSSTSIQRCHYLAKLYDETCEPDEKMLDVYTFTFIELGVAIVISALLCVATGLAVHKCRSAQKPLSISADSTVLAVEDAP